MEFNLENESAFLKATNLVTPSAKIGNIFGQVLIFLQLNLTLRERELKGTKI